jgi:hypothetical protein
LAEQSGRRSKIHAFERASRVAGVVVCAYLFLDRFSKPLARPFSMGLGVFTFDKGARLITRNFQSEQRPPA